MIDFSPVSCVLTLIVAISVVAPADAESKPEQKWSELKSEVRKDPAPEKITRGRHYVVSDERRHDLFRESIEGLGGVFVGVGTNQCYLMAAWARPEAMVVVDFDQVIIDLHRVYEVAFRHAGTPEAFVESWGRTREAQQKMRESIKATFDKGPVRRAALAAFKEYRANVAHGLNKMLTAMGEQGVSTFIDDAEQYGVIRQLFVDDAVLLIRGDFTGRRTLSDLGEVMQRAGLKLGALYLSNVEQYFPWGKGKFRENMLGLPTDERSVILRTYGYGVHGAADHNYRYFVQGAANFHDWLEDKKIRAAPRMLKSAAKTDIVGFRRVTLSPEDYAAELAAKKPNPGASSGVR